MANFRTLLKSARYRIHDAETAGDLVRVLDSIRQLRDRAADAEAAAVAEARAAGMSWAQIGLGLEISAQGAQQRHGRPAN